MLEIGLQRIMSVVVDVLVVDWLQPIGAVALVAVVFVVNCCWRSPTCRCSLCCCYYCYHYYYHYCCCCCWRPPTYCCSYCCTLLQHFPSEHLHCLQNFFTFTLSKPQLLVLLFVHCLQKFFTFTLSNLNYQFCSLHFFSSCFRFFFFLLLAAHGLRHISFLWPIHKAFTFSLSFGLLFGLWRIFQRCNWIVFSSHKTKLKNKCFEKHSFRNENQHA